MMLVANAPMFDSRQTGWVNCGDPVPTDLEGYVLVPYPANSTSYLDATAVPYKSIAKEVVGPAQYLQLAAPTKGPGVLEGQAATAFVIQCVTGLK